MSPKARSIVTAPLTVGTSIVRSVTGHTSGREEAARKAAATRKRQAAGRSDAASRAAETRRERARKRSAAAKRAARTRAQRDARVEAMREATQPD